MHVLERVILKSVIRRSWYF